MTRVVDISMRPDGISLTRPGTEPQEFIVAPTIELVTNGDLVDGTEGWWDDIDSALNQQPVHNTLLHLVEPYGITIYVGHHLDVYGAS